MLFTNKKPEDSTARPAAPPGREQPAMAAMSPSAAQLRPSMAGAPPPCIIDAGLVITGNLESERDVQLDGEVHGDIRCMQLIVNRNATLLGNVVATDVVIRGKVRGTIRADQVMLQDTARVESEIFHKSLVVEQGAAFDGEAYRTDKAAGAEAPDARLAELQAMSTGMKPAGQDDDKGEAAAA